MEITSWSKWGSIMKVQGMGFISVLTLIFIVLKLIGVIDWSWFFVLLPVILSIVFFLIMIAFLIFIYGKRR